MSMDNLSEQFNNILTQYQTIYQEYINTLDSSSNSNGLIAVPNTSTNQIGGARKRLFRDIDTKLIGGVCAGLSKYFDIRVRYIRLLFLVPSILLVLNWNHFHLFQFWEFDVYFYMKT